MRNRELDSSNERHRDSSVDDPALASAREMSTEGRGPARLAFGAAPPEWRPRSGAVSVWLADLDRHALEHPGDLELLDGPERERARRFHTEELRSRHVAAHAILRRVLARALDADPRRLQIARRDDGKPHLSSPPASALSFNLSHSDHLMLLALCIGAEIGVDLERIRPLSDRDAIARRVFTPGERAPLEHGEDDRRERAFFEAWSRKEAVIKATGEGLRAPLQDIEIQGEGSPERRIARRNTAGPGAAVEWSVVDLVPAPDFAAALAIPLGRLSVECYAFRSEL